MGKRLLLQSVCMSSIIFTAIAGNDIDTSSAICKTSNTSAIQTMASMTKDVKVKKSERLKSDVMLQQCTGHNGLEFKRIVSNTKNRADYTITPSAVAALSHPAYENASQEPFSEGFEAYPGENPEWLPEGWSIKSDLATTNHTPWGISEASPMLPPPSGNYFMGINFNSEPVDEWLITPQVTVPESGQLQFLAYIDPLFLFDLTYVDWEAMAFTEKHTSATLQIMVKPQDGEWSMAKDFVNDYMEFSLEELMTMTPSALQLKTVSLSDYSGQTVQVGFRYVGTDGNTMFIDNVFIGQPAMEVSFTWPQGNLFYGLSGDFSALNYSIPVLPVYTPLTWTNTTDVEDASFTWLYHSATTNDYDFTTTTDLTETYYPDYTSEFTTRNNLYYTPTLSGEAPGYSTGSINKYTYFQAGGKPEWEAKDPQGNKTILDMTLSTFDIQTEGLTIVGVANDDQAATPIYGYNSFTDKFWTDYTFQGQEEEGEGVKMTAILNYFLTPLSPMVIEGVTAFGRGQIGENAEFTIEIIPLSEEGTMTEPIATAKCKGNQMNMFESGMQNAISIPFIFETPLVMSSEVCDMYVVRLSGFNDPENVTYFAPYQSEKDNPDGMALGWIEKEITMSGNTRISLTPTANYTAFTSFALNLNAYYPWMADRGEKVESITICTTPVELPLSTYHDASEITATTVDGNELPEWLDVQISGRYGTAKAVLTGKGEGVRSCDMLLSAPGVSKKVTVNFNSDPSGIDSVDDNNEDTMSEIFNISGQRVTDIDNLNPGVYIIRYASGKVKKMAVK